MEDLSLAGCSKVKDFSFLKTLTTLETLNLNECQIKNLSILSRLRNLQAVDIPQHSQNNLDPLKKLPNLANVMLEGQEISS